MSTINMKKGTYQFHPDPNFNYQLNRTVMLSNAPIEEIQEVSKRITDIPSMIHEMRLMADNALGRGNEEQALAYIRTAEFFMKDDNPDKEKLYRQYKDLYYRINDGICSAKGLKRFEIPYETAYLPVVAGIPSGSSKGTILIHGGFDSYLEEFIPSVVYFMEQGYSTYLFEGPGQGECIHISNIPFTKDWDKPVRSIIEYFNLDDVTLIGISLGSLLALRASKEPRVSHIAAWSILPDFYEVLLSDRPKILRYLLGFLLNLHAKQIVNTIINAIAKKETRVGWGIPHGMYVFGKDTPYDFLRDVRTYTLRDIAPDIHQDVLLLGAANDHFIPLNMYKEEIELLKQVRSMTLRIFTDKESADNHCNIGNLSLTLKTISSWIETVHNRE